METWVLAQNPGDAPATVTLTFMTGSGSVPGPRNHTIPARSRQSFNAGTYVTDWDVSAKAEASAPVICERAVYGGGRTWAHDSIGYTSPL